MSTSGRPPDTKATKDDAGKGDSGGLNTLQIAAATGASTTAAVVANALGIYGTVVGVAVFSVVSSVATVLFLKSMHRTKQGIDRVVKSRGSTVTVTAESGSAVSGGTQTSADSGGTVSGGTEAVIREPVSQQPSQAPAGREFFKRNWRTIAMTSIIVFALSVGILTAVALMSGKPATAYYDTNPPAPASTNGPEDSEDPGGGDDQDGTTSDEEEEEEPSSQDETSQPSEESNTPGETPEDTEPSTQDSGGEDEPTDDQQGRGATPQPDDSEAAP